MKAMTEREFLAQKGLADPASGWCLDKLRSNKELRTIQGRKRYQKKSEIYFYSVPSEYSYNFVHAAVHP